MEEMRRKIEEYFRNNMGIYILIAALFTGGVLSGALSLRGLGEEQLLQLNRYFMVLAEGLQDCSGTEQGAIFRQALHINFRYLLLISFLGLFPFGFPLIAGLVGLRGFSLGFTVAFLVGRNSLRGVLFAAGAILPHNLILIPAVILGSVTAFSLSWFRLRCALERRPRPLREQLGPYLLILLLTAVLMGAAILVEAYISPLFVKWLIPVIQ